MDLTNLVTLVDADKLEEILTAVNYDSERTQFLVDGFRNGFTIGYAGSRTVKLTAPNLKIRVGSEVELWNKMIKEVEAKRYAGPFAEIPFQDYYIQSPIGLVPKDNGKCTCLKFHLSYPRDGKSLVNYNTPKEMCTMKRELIVPARNLTGKQLLDISP